MQKYFMQVEDYCITKDMDFLKNMFIPYLKDIFEDLLIRGSNLRSNERLLEKTTFLEYCNLPIIIAERLFICVATNAKSKYITENQFINAFVLIFNSELDSRIKLTFEMYDFNQDGQVTKEDIRMILSYIPFKRNLKLQGNTMKLEPIIQKKNKLQQSPLLNKKNEEEGLYKKSEGKDLNHQDRKEDQREIQDFLDKVFENQQSMSFSDYKAINCEMSSEMFLSIMSVFHERIPCATNFFRLKRVCQIQQQGVKISCRSTNTSLTRTIASPTMLKNIQVINGSPNIPFQNPRSPLIFNNKQINYKKQDSEKISALDLDNDGPSSPQNNEQFKRSNVEIGDTDQIKIPNFSGSKRDGESSDYSYNERRLGDIQSTESSSKFLQRRLQRGKSKISDSSALSPKQNQASGSETFLPSPISPSFLAPFASGKNSPQSPDGARSPINKSTFSRKPSRIQPGKDLYGQECQDQTSIKISNQNQISPTDKFIYSNFGGQDDQGENFHEGDIFFQTKSGKYKRYHGLIMRSEFYCYSPKDKSKHKLMHSLKGAFIKKQVAIKDELRDRLLYPIKFIIPPTKYRVFYFLSQEDQVAWYNQFKKAMGQENIEDYYKLDKVIGKGSFGTVRIGFHLKTASKVAVKIIKKQSEDQSYLLQQRKEIEVLKICQHPNIVQLLDLFENHKSFYIVLEFMKGGDLFDYLKSQKKRLSEKRIKAMIKQIALALQYLHSYGIIHRDLKLENIMMSDDTDQAIPKLVDFGLAKILGPQETSDEPYGTLGYTAPEVLQSEPYSFSCDIWSLGCITAVMLTGQLPFYNEKSSLVVEKTCTQEIQFDDYHWRLVSTKAKDFVASVLNKDPLKRLTLEQVFEHEWIKTSKHQ